MRRAAVVAAAVVVVGLAAGWLLSDRGDEHGDLDPPPAAVRAYRIVYRVEVFTSTREESHREVAVRRPFDSRDVTTPVGGGADTATGFVANGTQQFALQPGKALDLGHRPEQSAPGDVRFGAELDDLVRLGLARRRPTTARIAGRRCTDYRFGSPLGDPLRKASADEYADLCLDDAGLVLREQWYLNGKLLRRTIATSVSLRVPGDDAFGVNGLSVSANATGTGAVQPLSRRSVPDTGLPYWTTDDPPWGFSLRGRARGVVTGGPEGASAVQDLVYVDTYTRGADVISVEHREAAIASGEEGGMERVDGGRLGQGDVTLTAQGPFIRFEAGKWIVTVRGTVDVAHLREFARGLRPAKR